MHLWSLPHVWILCQLIQYAQQHWISKLDLILPCLLFHGTSWYSRPLSNLVDKLRSNKTVNSFFPTLSSRIWTVGLFIRLFVNEGGWDTKSILWHTKITYIHLVSTQNPTKDISILSALFPEGSRGKWLVSFRWIVGLILVLLHFSFLKELFSVLKIMLTIIFMI